MSVVSRILERAKSKNGRVVFPEGHDERILGASRYLVDQGIGRPIILGETARIAAAAEGAGLALGGIEIIDPAASGQLGTLAAEYRRRRDVPENVALRLVKKTLVYGGMLVARGDADSMVAGVEKATTLVIQSAVLTVGYAPGIQTVSSFFLMILPKLGDRSNAPLIYADCGVTIQPTAEQLADIAISAEATAAQLLDEPPRVAMLSFSTRGSAACDDVSKVQRAVQLARQRRPEAAIDGEFQADAALSPRVAAKKVKRASDVAGQANVLVFPDLDAGNIAYKLTQYLAGAQALGPVLQGLAKPVSDLSRGASVDDIVMTSAICLAQT